MVLLLFLFMDWEGISKIGNGISMPFQKIIGLMPLIWLCGLTEKPSAPYSTVYLTDSVQNFLALKNIKEACFVGHSLGAGIVIELCLRNPQLVKKLVLLSGLGFKRKAAIELRIITLPIIGELLNKPDRNNEEQYLKMLFYDKNLVTDEMVNLSFGKTSQPGTPETYLATLRSIGNFFGLKKEIAQKIKNNAHRITVPTLVLWGEEDKVLPVEQAYIAEKILPNATLHIFKKCGHMPQIECAEEFNDLVINFLSD